MKSQLFIGLSLVVTLYCNNLFANISSETLTGDFKVGQCSLQFDRASITQNDHLQVTFFKDNQETTTVVFLNNQSSSSVDVDVVASSFTISNIIKDKILMNTKTIKIGRSASGGRVRIVEMDSQDQKYFECVLYRK